MLSDVNHKNVVLLRKRKLKIFACVLCEDLYLCLNEKADTYIRNTIIEKQMLFQYHETRCMLTLVLSGTETEITLKKLLKKKMVVRAYSMG